MRRPRQDGWSTDLQRRPERRFFLVQFFQIDPSFEAITSGKPLRCAGPDRARVGRGLENKPATTLRFDTTQFRLLPTMQAPSAATAALPCL